MSSSVELRSRDYRVKVVGVLQKTCALSDRGNVIARAYFITDTNGIFDEMTFPISEAAVAELTRSGFKRSAERSDFQAFLRLHKAPINRGEHPSGANYNSGRIWRP